MYTHKLCGNEVVFKSTVHEYSRIINIEKGGYVETGDVEDSCIEDSEIWCETCCMTVATLNVAGISEEIEAEA